MTPIAVVGIDCRFPGARDKDAFWRVLLDGVVTDTEIPPQRWNVDRYYHPDGIAGSMNTRRAHFLDDADAFDNEFFGIAPVEAAVLDPQQRLLLQASWRALQDGGIDPKSLAGTATGVFVGVMSGEWGNRQMYDYPRLTPFHGSGSGYFMLANRISYHLNLIGPSMAIDTACSSSLTALHQACSALRAGDVDIAIAGGANLVLTPALSVFYTQAGLSAPDGRCKPFCQNADGIGRGEGVAAVVLRRLDDAIAAGQPIYAVVKASAVNHDGRSNGVTAPNRRSQAELMRRTLRLAEVDAQQLDFVEAHGTGTVLGDMIEANALGDLHRSRTGAPCLLGSVKGNIGHTEGAAGIASFIKACLSLHHRVLPATVVVGQPNPGLRLGSQGLTLTQGALELSPEGTLAAVSSFGLGGSNAHVVLESAPVVMPARNGALGVLTLSAPHERALRRNAETYQHALRDLDGQRVGSWCHTTNVVNRSHRHRLVAHGDRDGLLASLEGYLNGDGAELVSSAPIRKGEADVGLLCSGQGTQYAGMTRLLYHSHPAYREQLEAVCAVLDRHLPASLLATILGEQPGLDDTRLAQPALFAVGYALGKTLLDTGIRPAFGIGHSIGEITVAALAGVLSVADAAAMVVTRGELMGALEPGGAMIAVDVPLEQVHPLVDADPECAVAAVNGPRAVVISGPAAALATLSADIRRGGGRVQQLTVSHAFHSPSMRPVVADFRHAISGLVPKAAAFPIFSTVTGTQVDGLDMDADHWARQICSPVRFGDALDAATRAVRTSYVAEAGPRATLLSLARQCGLPPQIRSLRLCGGPESTGSELLEVAAVLLRDGYSPDLSQLYGRPLHTLEHIAPYTFDATNRFWFTEAAAPQAEPSNAEPSKAEPSIEPADDARAAPSDLAGEVLVLIARVGGYPVHEITRSSRLSEDLGYDSLLQLRLFEQVRRQYPQLALKSVADLPSSVDSVGSLVDLMVERLSVAGAVR
ncbi:type I polyketide synthase [Mycobacterium angelicum]|uniref:Polyketide synthase n=1 Tax=Mycobacterium angelicum TaxID=470074 RepID=A0A1W9ZQW3_MYCAN|nr:type I polyketide synthase [Mycobacterium angelicum]MCV7198849.1 acyltransferase domain-containing protein [Mycobacterium angelicum]ORA20227.1 polyketide synthase [Mycobacterium angelicum]